MGHPWDTCLTSGRALLACENKTNPRHLLSLPFKQKPTFEQICLKQEAPPHVRLQLESCGSSLPLGLAARGEKKGSGPQIAFNCFQLLGTCCLLLASTSTVFFWACLQPQAGSQEVFHHQSQPTFLGASCSVPCLLPRPRVVPGVFPHPRSSC